MATRKNETPAQQTPTVYPTYFQEDEFNGTPMFKVIRDFMKQGKMQQDWMFNGGPGKWARLLGKDADGDSVLLNVVDFLREHSEDFASVLSDVDHFVMGYLAFRGEYLDSDNSDLLGSATPTQTVGEEVQDEVVELDPRDVILASEQFASLCSDVIVGQAVQEEVYQDFLATGSSLEEYLESLGQFAEDGNVFALLAGRQGRSAREWKFINAQEMAAPTVEQPEPAKAPEPTAPTITDGAARHYGSMLATLPMWAAASIEERQYLIIEAFTLVQSGGKWAVIKAEMMKHKTVSSYLAAMAK